jgi:type IV secretion system protein TrbL
MASHMASGLSNGAAEYQMMKGSTNSIQSQQTVGGEIANKIRKHSRRQSNHEQDEFEGDSLTGSKNLDLDASVSAVTLTDASTKHL